MLCDLHLWRVCWIDYPRPALSQVRLTELDVVDNVATTAEVVLSITTRTRLPFGWGMILCSADYLFQTKILSVLTSEHVTLPNSDTGLLQGHTW